MSHLCRHTFIEFGTEIIIFCFFRSGRDVIEHLLALFVHTTEHIVFFVILAAHGVLVGQGAARNDRVPRVSVFPFTVPFPFSAGRFPTGRDGDRDAPGRIRVARIIVVHDDMDVTIIVVVVVVVVVVGVVVVGVVAVGVVAVAVSAGVVLIILIGHVSRIFTILALRVVFVVLVVAVVVPTTRAIGTVVAIAVAPATTSTTGTTSDICIVLLLQ